MPEPHSTHLPGVSGAVEAVTITKVIDTGLRDVQAMTVSMLQDSVAAEATVTALPIARVAGSGDTQKYNLKTWNADGVTPGVAAVNVSWLALGK